MYVCMYAYREDVPHDILDIVAHFEQARLDVRGIGGSSLGDRLVYGGGVDGQDDAPTSFDGDHGILIQARHGV